MSPAPAPHPLGSREVHVWLADLDAIWAAEPNLLDQLSPDELERAQRFVFEHLRRRFTAAHALLRRTLALYAACDPLALRFTASDFGKPQLTDHSGLHFNLSHSAAMAAIAVGRAPVGIDIEEVRPMPDMLSLAESFFAATEVHALRQALTAGDHEAFFRCWTRKEAVIKAHGHGLSIPLDAFTVSLASHIDTLTGSERFPISSHWRLTTLDLPVGFCGAVAAEAGFDTVTTFRIPA